MDPVCETCAYLLYKKRPSGWRSAVRTIIVVNIVIVIIVVAEKTDKTRYNK